MLNRTYIKAICVMLISAFYIATTFSEANAMPDEAFYKTTSIKATNCDATLDFSKPWEAESCVQKRIGHEEFEMQIEYNTIGLGEAAKQIGIESFLVKEWIKIGDCKGMNDITFCVEREGDKACAYGYPLVKLPVGGSEKGANCRQLPKPASNLRPPEWSNLISPVCTNYDQSSSQFYKRNYNGTISTQKMSFTGVVVECIEDTMTNIFLLGRSEVEVDPETGLVIATQTEVSGAGLSFFEIMQTNLKGLVSAILALYVTLFALKFLMSHQIPKKGELMWVFLKIALVSYFAIGPGMANLYPALLGTAKDFSIIMLEAGLGDEELIDNSGSSAALLNSLRESGIAKQNVTNLQNTLSSYNEQLATMQPDLNAAKQDLDAAKTDFDTNDAILRSMEQEMSKNQKEAEALRQEIAASGQKITEYERDIYNTTQEIAKATTDAAAREKELETAITNASNAAKEAADASADLTTKLDDYNEKQKAVDDALRDALAIAQKEFDEADTAFKTATELYDSYYSKITEFPSDTPTSFNEWASKSKILWDSTYSKCINANTCSSWGEMNGTSAFSSMESYYRANPQLLAFYKAFNPTHYKIISSYLNYLDREEIKSSLPERKEALDAAYAEYDIAKKQLDAVKISVENSDLVKAARSALSASTAIKNAAQTLSEQKDIANKSAQNAKTAAENAKKEADRVKANFENQLKNLTAEKQQFEQDLKAKEERLEELDKWIAANLPPLNSQRISTYDKQQNYRTESGKYNALKRQETLLSAQIESTVRTLSTATQTFEERETNYLSTYRSSTSRSFGYNYCSFKNATYPEGKDYMKLWDMIDCRFSKYLGINEVGSEGHPKLLYLLFTAPISIPPIGILVLFLGILFLIFIILIILRMVHIYIIAIVVLTLLVYFSPIIIPAVLFGATKSIFDKWVKQIISFILQPIILFAFLTMVFAITDKVIYKDNHFFANNRIVADPETGDCPDPDALGCIYEKMVFDFNAKSDSDTETINGYQHVTPKYSFTGKHDMGSDTKLPVWSGEFREALGGWGGKIILRELSILVFIGFIVANLLATIESIAQRLTNGAFAVGSKSDVGGKAINPLSTARWAGSKYMDMRSKDKEKKAKVKRQEKVDENQKASAAKNKEMESLRKELASFKNKKK